MWLAHSAIPPVPAHAQLPAHVLASAFEAISDEAGNVSTRRLTKHFARCETEQPELARWLGEKLSRPMDDAARGLGAALATTLWMAFSWFAGARLRQVTKDDLESTQKLLDTDEDLRRNNPRVVMESDDIIAMQQPSVAKFVRDRTEETMRMYADEIDVDDVDAVYRMLLVETLVLSYAVADPAQGQDASKNAPS